MKGLWGEAKRSGDGKESIRSVWRAQSLVLTPPHSVPGNPSRLKGATSRVRSPRQNSQKSTKILSCSQEDLNFLPTSFCTCGYHRPHTLSLTGAVLEFGEG